MQSMIFKYQEWFEKMRHIYGYPPSNEEENRYQAFRARLLDELTAEGRLPEALRIKR